MISMTGVLIRKELRELRAWGLLSLLIGLLDVLAMFTSQIDRQPLSYTFGILNDGGAVVFWLLAFAIGTGITTREHDDKTLMFLDGLPVSRSLIFFVKCSVVALLVLLAPLVRFVMVAALHLLSRGSLDHALHPDLLLQVLGLQILLVCNGLCLGAALGRLRNLTWLVAGALASGLMVLIKFYPRATLLNPLALLDTQLSSAGLAVDMETVCAQFALAALGLLVAWRGFLRAGQSRVLVLPPRPVVGAAVTLMTTIALGATVILFVFEEAENELSASTPTPSESALPYFPPSPPARTATEHYNFSYPAHGAEAALALSEQADEIFERVHAALGVPAGRPIDVDASGSMRNTHGTAYFGRIRMALTRDARIVLAHETAHVVTQRMAGDHRDWLWQAAPVLNEGVASWVESKFRTEDDEDDTRMLVLAALHARRELIIEEFASPRILNMMRDEAIKYPAGEALIAAAVSLHGEPALPRLLRAFDDDRLPTDLSGLPLWQATFQLAGMDLGAVIDEFYREVASLAERHADLIAALPRPRVRLIAYDGAFGAQAIIDGKQTQAALTLRFKPAPDSTYDTIDAHPTMAFAPVWRNPSDIAGGQICVQAGIDVFGGATLYEPWGCLPIGDAVEWEPPEWSNE